MPGVNRHQRHDDAKTNQVNEDREKNNEQRWFAIHVLFNEREVKRWATELTEFLSDMPFPWQESVSRWLETIWTVCSSIRVRLKAKPPLRKNFQVQPEDVIQLRMGTNEHGIDAF